MSSYSDGTFYRSNTSVNPFVAASIQNLTPGVSIDFGCGMGFNSLFLKANKWQTYVVDQEPIPIGFLRHFIDSDKIVQSDIRLLNFDLLPKADLILVSFP